MFSKQVIAPLMLAVTLGFLTMEQAAAQTLYGMAGSLQTREHAHNVDWAYGWGIDPGNPLDPDTVNYEWVPMIWSASVGGVQNQINQVLSVESRLGLHVDYVLGFNEPELPTQANMSVQQALDVWEVMTEQFSGTDIKMVSPAVSGGGAIRVDDPARPDGWLTEFMDGVEAANSDADPNNDLQVDVIAYHFYSVAFNGTSEANKLIDQIDDLYARYGRPIWITEFAGTSFSLDNPVHSTEERQAFNRAFLAALIPQFDSRPYVERVAWWQFGALGRPYSALTTVSGGVYTPTIIGEEYMRTTLDSGQTYNFATRDFRPTYVHYLKGSHLSNTGPALPEALRAVDVMEGTTNMSGTGDFGFELADDAFVRIRDGATLRKQGNNAVTVRGAPVSNEGELLIEDGTLRLEDGVRMTGEGLMRIDSSGTVATSGDFADEVTDLDLPTIIMDQGLLHVEDGLTTISSQLSLQAVSEIRTDGNLVVSGETTGTGSIVATGAGSLFLKNDGLHTGGAQVTEGSLVVANTEASPTGSGNVSVGGTGTFGGFGQVDGNLTASAGAVAPGISETSTGATSAPVFEEGVLVDAIDFDFTGIQDDAPLAQTSTLASGLRLVAGLDFGSGVRPRNAANNGNEFNVAGFRTDTNAGAGLNAGDYLTFTIAPVDGLAMVVEDVTFELRRNGTGAAKQYTVATSIDGFSWPERWGNLVLDSADTTTQVFTSSNLGTEAIADEVEIRIVGVGATSDAGNTHFYAASVDASFVSDPNSVGFDPTGILELGGNYTQLDFATLEIDLGGTAAGEFDQLQVDGNVTLSGTLDVSMLEGFAGAAGQTFDIITADSISGTFASVIPPAGMNVQVNYSNTIVSLQLLVGLVGDFDADGDVDVDDINFYAGNIGSTATGPLAQLDLTGDGQITNDDLKFHIENFVQTSNGETGTFPGDLNLDGTVNVLGDAFTLISNLNKATTSYAQGDINLDGTVNVLGDAFALIGNLNKSNASSAAN